MDDLFQTWIKSTRKSIGRGSSSFVRIIQSVTTVAAKPFINNENNYQQVLTRLTNQEKLARDFQTIGKDMYRSLDKYAKSNHSR